MTMTQFEIAGYLVGPIYEPGSECFKTLSYTFQREQDKSVCPFVPICESLHNALLTVTSDGDFRYCKVAQGSLTIRRVTQTKGGTRVTRERSFSLARFPSIADMLRDEWGWVEFQPEE